MIRDSSDSKPMRLELTHSLIPFESSDNNRGLSLLVQKIEVGFVFHCQSLSQTFWSYPIFSIIRCEFRQQWENCGDSALSSELSRAIGSNSILPNRIGFWPLCLAGTSKKASCASSVFSCTIKGNLIGACNDVRTSKGSLSTSIIVSDGTESEANTER